MDNIFEFNDISNIKIESINGYNIYMMDNFYKKPKEVQSFINSHYSQLHKINQKPSFNGKYFLDKRHSISDDRMLNVTTTLGNLIGKYPSYPLDIFTNCILFLDKEFNDYKNNYWVPHTDPYHVALVYFDEQEGSGTNLYEQLKPDDMDAPEHYAPWRSASKYKIIKTITSRYNRLIMFDGKILHGMAIDDDRFFDVQRMNQAIFI